MLYCQFNVDSDTQCTWVRSRVTCYHVSNVEKYTEADARVSTFKMWNFVPELWHYFGGTISLLYRT